jgi:hypothetical protein
MLPIPFFFANMALKLPVSVHHLAGQPLIMIFLAVIYILHTLLRVPILLAIAASLVIYCGTARLLIHVLPTDVPWLFWTFFIFDGLLGLVLYFIMDHKHEAGNRTPLPLYIKLPCIMLIILILVIIKNWLGGFMTVFPMVTTIAAYEARGCLWTMTRQMGVNVTLFAVMIAVVFIAQFYGHFSTVPSLLCGWGGYFLAMAVYNRIFPGSCLPVKSAKLLPQ